jgi:hypothetical protein
MYELGVSNCQGVSYGLRVQVQEQTVAWKILPSNMSRFGFEKRSSKHLWLSYWLHATKFRYCIFAIARNSSRWLFFNLESPPTRLLLLRGILRELRVRFWRGQHWPDLPEYTHVIAQQHYPAITCTSQEVGQDLSFGKSGKSINKGNIGPSHSLYCSGRRLQNEANGTI